MPLTDQDLGMIWVGFRMKNGYFPGKRFISRILRMNGDLMAYKLVAAGLILSLLVFGGIVLAIPMVENATNVTKIPQESCGRPEPLSEAAGANISMPNETQIGEFDAAVQSGDFETAKALDNEYHLGGPIFGKLNQTTFATYSQIAVLKRELMIELGLNQTRDDGFGAPMMGGMAPPQMWRTGNDSGMAAPSGPEGCGIPRQPPSDVKP